MNKTTALARAAEPTETALATPAIFESVPVEAILARTRKVHEVAARVMQADVHYGTIPGTKKPSLLKPGAQLLCVAFMFRPEFEIVREILDPDRVHYTIRCNLVHIPTGILVSTGLGSCSSFEKKYRYRVARRSCPKCQAEAIFQSKRGRDEWFCWVKKGGCGATFPIDDLKILDQHLGRVLNEDPHDQGNTVLKMAEKRALVSAVVHATGASDTFHTFEKGQGPQQGPGAQREAPELSEEDEEEIKALHQKIHNGLPYLGDADREAVVRDRDKAGTDIGRLQMILRWIEDQLDGAPAPGPELRDGGL